MSSVPKVSDWMVSLVSAKRWNGQYRYVRVQGEGVWDDAIAAAEAASPGWEGVVAGPFVNGTGLPLHATVSI